MKQTKLIVFLGPGGVGKTTSSAAVATALAKRGFKTVVMTVDPARRLAQAMGLKSLSNSAQLVKDYGKGSVDALWLSQNGALETLAKKHAPDEQSLHRMLEHKLFRIIESQLGGIEEYLGLEKALELIHSNKYDYCILDTPPSQHALDFFDSPQHLLEFFDESVIQYFSKNKKESNWINRTLSKGRTKALELFQNLLGKSFFNDLATLLSLLEPLHQALRDTAKNAHVLLRSEDCTYALVGILEEHPLKDLYYLNAMLTAKGLSKSRYWLANKTLPTSEFPDLKTISQILGDQKAQWIEHQKNQQDYQLEHISETSKLPDAYALLPCYSINQFSLSELEEMGEEALKQWKI